MSSPVVNSEQINRSIEAYNVSIRGHKENIEMIAAICGIVSAFAITFGILALVQSKYLLFIPAGIFLSVSIIVGSIIPLHIRAMKTDIIARDELRKQLQAQPEVSRV